ncbi:phage adaptor protein [Massilia antarctica]|uniref:phage adaptor protein n=1 Tax=Massilia antarctica TaxID=2765360 RepID=UPI0035E59B3B
MPTTIASAVVGRAARLLQDHEYVRWTQPEMLDWLIDGQREAALINPSLYVITGPLTLAAGTLQRLPDDGKALLDVPRNENGYAVTRIARKALDAQVPDWHRPARAKTKVLHFCLSGDDATTFYVYPPSPGGNVVTAVYEAIPPALLLGDSIALDDSYVSALVDYLMYRAYEKDSEYAPENAGFAALHRAAFNALVKGTAPATVSPT